MIVIVVVIVVLYVSIYSYQCYYYSTDRQLNKYRKSAEQGDADAQNNLGECYAYAKNPLKAAEWYHKAAAQGECEGAK